MEFASNVLTVSFALAHKSKTNKAEDGKTSTPVRDDASTHHRTNNLNKDSHPFVFHLERAIGNQAVRRIVPSDMGGFDFGRIGIQPKLRMSQQGDKYEQESDRVAEKGMNIADPSVLSAPVTTSIDQEEIDRKCTACEMKEEEEEMEISRKLSDSCNLEASDQFTNKINNVRSGEASSLGPSTKEFMESRFGYDFGSIKIHTGERAASSARAVNALAYTIGNDIVFGEGQYQPNTLQGRRLLAHELAHTIQQGREEGRLLNFDSTIADDTLEQEAELASNATMIGEFASVTQNTGAKIARQTPATTASPSAPVAQTAITRAEFNKIMKERYKVVEIRTGKIEEQQEEYQNSVDIQKPLWKEWDPGESSPIYAWIVEAFAKFEAQVGGVPPVRESVFFQTHYQSAGLGHVIPDKLGKGVVASEYGSGTLTIYSSVIKGNEMLQIQGGLTSPTEKQNVQRNVAHELGHGVSEILMDKNFLKDKYGLAVGWTKDQELYDIGEKEVQDALLNKDGKSPPDKFRIDRDNFDEKTWKERPLTGYMTTNWGDDFAEALSAYVNEPQTLKSLSPYRYKFLDEHKAEWLPLLRKKHVNIWEQAAIGSTKEDKVKPERKTIWERVLEQ